MKNQICSPRIFGLELLAGFMLLGSSFAFTQNSDTPAAARMRALNNSLLSLHGQMQKADANSGRNLRSQAATVINERATVLSNLIQNNPRAALTFSFSPELLADLAAKVPQSASQLESHATVTGTVQHWIADAPGLKSSRSWWIMNAGSGRNLYLFFAAGEPTTARSGQLLQATGVIAGTVMAVETSASPSANSGLVQSPTNLTASKAWPVPALGVVVGFVFGLPGLGGWREHSAQLLSPIKYFAVYGLIFFFVCFTTTPSWSQAACSTTGQQNAVVLLATTPTATIPAGVTPQTMQEAFFGTTPPNLNGFWQEASYGKMSVTGDVYGWYTLAGTYSCTSIMQMRNDAIAAASAAGVNFQKYDQVYVVVPDYGCGWAGLTYMGCTVINTPTGSFNAATTFLDSNYMTPPSIAVSVIAHEGGHQLGLNHSGTLDNGTAVLGPLSAPGTPSEFGDWYSTMGSTSVALYPAPHKAEILGWMASGTNYEIVQNSGTYALGPLEANAAGLQAIKVQRGTGNNAWLWIEYRQSIGNYDSTLNPQGFAGALIHYEDSTTGAYTKLLDFTPDSYTDPGWDFYDSPLSPGQTWQDPYTNLSLTVSSANSSGVTVNVNYGSVPCTHANPTVAITPLDPSTYPGSGASYTMNVINNDSSACSASTFTPSSAQPSGFTPAFSVGSISLSPGQSGSLTMSQTPASGTPPGTYPVSASASNLSYVGTGTGNVTVMSAPSLTVSVSVSGSSFTPPSTVPITATVLSGGTPLPGANVTFTVTLPNGSTTTQTATTGSGGTITWSYKLNGKSTAGTYLVSATAGQSGGTKKATSSTQSAFSSSVAFTVP